MRILVSGATGMVGSYVVKQALDRRHEVTAIARNISSLAIEHSNLTKISCDILDRDAIQPHLCDIDVVINTVGIGVSKTPTTLYSQGARNLISGMNTYGVKRLVVISSEVAEHWAHQGLFKIWLVLPLLQKFFGATYDDMRRMDVVLLENNVQWTSIRAPRIRNAPAKEHYRLDMYKPLSRGWSITAPDMATALLDIAEREDLGRHHVYVAN